MRDSAAYAIAWHRDRNDEVLNPKTAAVELINVLRPTVAVARYVTFAALALHQHPDVARELERGSDEDLERFVQEVRRFYPFFPAIGGRVEREFDWRGHHFVKGTWVLLDIYGTNHDPRTWRDPEAFRPDRFKVHETTPFDFVPQGGGSHAQTHRCPGEDITVALVKSALRHLATLRYDVPPQDLSIDLATMPTLPASGFVMANIKSRTEHA
jgi:fatty-acid peroxygenase